MKTKEEIASIIERNIDCTDIDAMAVAEKIVESDINMKGGSMKKNTIIAAVSVAFLVLGTAGLFLGGTSGTTIGEIVSAVIVVVGLIAGIFSYKTKPKV